MKLPACKPSLGRLQWLPAFLAIFLMQGAVHAQTTGADSAPSATFTLSANRVLVDVTVTDTQGQPVHGLSRHDFTVEEDGAAQTILSFEAFDFEKEAEPVPLAPAAMRRHTFMNLPRNHERGPLYVLLYDLVNISPVDQIPARAALLRFIEDKPEGTRFEDKPEGTRFALFVRSDRLHLVQGFTSDRETLLSAVAGKGVPRVFMMGGNFGQDSKGATLDAIDSIARFLSPEEGRKNLIWFSGNFPLSLFPSSADPVALQEEGKRELNRLTASQVAIYPVDVSGVVIADEYGPPGSAGETEIAPDQPRQRPAGHGYSLISHNQMAEDDLAKATGGEAIYSTNDIVSSLRKATLDGGNYYSLSYSPSKAPLDGRLRQIRVKVRQEGSRLSYRRAYYSSPSAASPAETGIAGAMAHGAPQLHQLIFGLEVSPQPASAAHDKKERYLLAYRVMAPPPSPNRPTTAPRFEIAAAAYSADGELLNSIVNLATEPATAAQASSEKSFRIEQELEVPAATHFLRVAVRNSQSGKEGAMEIPLPLAPAP